MNVVYRVDPIGKKPPICTDIAITNRSAITLTIAQYLDTSAIIHTLQEMNYVKGTWDVVAFISNSALGLCLQALCI